MGYVTLQSAAEAELAVVRLHKSTFKGAVVTVTRVSALTLQGKVVRCPKAFPMSHISFERFSHEIEESVFKKC